MFYKPVLAAAAALAIASPAMANSSSFVSSTSFTGANGSSVSVITRTTGNGTVFGTARAGDRMIVVSDRGGQSDVAANSLFDSFWLRWIALFT